MGQLEKDFKKSFCWRPNLSNNGELKLRAYGKRQTANVRLKLIVSQKVGNEQIKTAQNNSLG